MFLWLLVRKKRHRPMPHTSDCFWVYVDLTLAYLHTRSAYQYRFVALAYICPCISTEIWMKSKYPRVHPWCRGKCLSWASTAARASRHSSSMHLNIAYDFWGSVLLGEACRVRRFLIRHDAKIKTDSVPECRYLGEFPNCQLSEEALQITMRIQEQKARPIDTDARGLQIF